MMETDERPVLRGVFGFVSAVGLGAGGLGFGLVLALMAAASLFLAGFEPGDLEFLVLSLVFVQGVGCIGVAFAYVKLRPIVAPPIREFLGISDPDGRFEIGISVPNLRDLLVVGGGYLLAFGGAIAGAYVIFLLQVDTGTNQAAAVAMDNPEVLLLLIPASLLLIGPGEELLFRGVVQGRLREIFGPAAAILLASLVFVGLHWFALTGGSPAGNLASLAILLVPSLVLGVSYEYTGNIVVPSLIHGIYNATLFTLLYVSIIVADELPEASEMVLTGLN